MSDAKKKILVVEDEDNLRELVQSRLENEGFEVATAADGFQAIGKARLVQPDLVILDLMIPKMDGYSVCRLFKSGGMAQTPIIIFSARSSPEDVRRCLDMGASAYVAKPFEAPVLLGKIRELLFPAEWAKEQEAARKEQASSPVPEAPSAGDKSENERELAGQRSEEERRAQD